VGAKMPPMKFTLILGPPEYEAIPKYALGGEKRNGYFQQRLLQVTAVWDQTDDL
jgi:hypothetical protein